MKQLFDSVSNACSKITTNTYSSSFSMGIYCLKKSLHAPIYAIYGFVRFADEIVDTFHDHDKATLFAEFKADTWKAIDRKISLNPILNSFQAVVHQYNVDHSLIECFLNSMEIDLCAKEHTRDTYDQYIVGSAEVVGLMCLRVFTNNDDKLYQSLKPSAMKLGAAFQKVNFLRDIKSDYEELGRVYFPGVDFGKFSAQDKQKIEREIHDDFQAAFEGIKALPRDARFGIYVAYVYYKTLFNKIQKIPPTKILVERVRISDTYKLSLLLTSYFKHRLSIL